MNAAAGRMASTVDRTDRSEGGPAAYTVADTPAVRARLEADLDDVVRTVRSGDPALQSLVLTGGFARGEGAVLAGRPQNDYDLVAVRGMRRPRRAYDAMRRELEDRLGLHIDLAPVAAARLRWTSPSIFWYETATRGRVLWGAPVLERIPTRDPRQIDPREGPRLLVNRAAGLLLAMDRSDQDKRIQASKALLAALDARLLAMGSFAPTHLERWQRYLALRRHGSCPPRLADRHDWLSWALRFKTEPARAGARDADDAWRVAAETVLTALPVGLEHAGFDDLESYAMHDGLLDRLHFLRRARRFARHPTGRVQVATVRMLEAALRDEAPDEAMAWLEPLGATRDAPPVAWLEQMRHATMQ